MQLHPKLRRIFDAYTDILFLVICLVTGIFYLWRPVFASYALIGIAVAILLVCGIINVIRYLRGPAELHGPNHTLAVGLGMIILAVVFAASPYLVIDLTTLLLGVMLFADALHLLQTAADGLRTHTQRWWAYLIPMVPAICTGFFFLFLFDRPILLGCSLLVCAAVTLALLILRKYIDLPAAEAKRVASAAAPAEAAPQEEVHEAPKMPFDQPID